MPEEPVLPILEISVFFVVKLFFLVGLAVYIVLAAVIIKQVNLMTGTLEAPLSASLRGIAITHFFLAVGIFLAALAFL